jgi:protein-tyrosine phosphatase
MQAPDPEEPTGEPTVGPDGGPAADGGSSGRRRTRVLVICTANICRSPMAEGFLAAMEPELDVRSAGFLQPGVPAAPDAVRVMAEHGVDISAHRSSVVGTDDLDWADLVLTMERRHARDLVVLQAAARSRVFTLGSFVAHAGRVGRRGGDVALDGLLELLDAERSTADLLGSGRDEVGDPYGRSVRRFRATAEELRGLTSAAVAVLASHRSVT